MSDPAPWPEGVGRRILDTCASTNAEALALPPDSAPLWIMARHQTGGRGRRGRAWMGAEGNFAATLALRPPRAPSDAALFSFVAALALDDTLRAACGPTATLAIKWPNDVLLNGGKVAGILLESAGRGGQTEILAVGIGVNLAHAPEPDPVGPSNPRPVSVAGETGLSVPPEAFLDLLAPAFARWQDVLTREGFAPIREAWLSRAAHLDRTIIARTGTAERHGTFRGIDETGALILDTATGRETIPAADIYFQGA